MTENSNCGSDINVPFFLIFTIITVIMAIILHLPIPVTVCFYYLLPFTNSDLVWLILRPPFCGHRCMRRFAHFISLPSIKVCVCVCVLHFVTSWHFEPWLGLNRVIRITHCMTLSLSKVVVVLPECWAIAQHFLLKLKLVSAFSNRIHST